jgi:hypothetical protein
MDGSEPSQDQTEQSSGEDEEVAEEDQADADSSNSAKRVRSLQPKYPRHNVERALRIAKAIFDQNGGRPATPHEAAAFVGSKSTKGQFGVEMASAKKYGFLETDDQGRLVLTNRARRALAPQSPTDRTSAFQEAVLAAPDISAVYNFYRGQSLPDPQFLNNALTERFKIPAEKTAEFLTIFYDDIKSAELLDESGERPRLIDIGRDEAHKPGPGKQQPAKAAKSLLTHDATCFVVQPFAAPLGGYYDSIYEPAIRQTASILCELTTRFLPPAKSWIRSGEEYRRRVFSWRS